MSDYLVKVTAAEGQIRGVVAVTTGLVEEARKRHDTYPTATAALGRVLTATLLMGSTMAESDLLTMRVIGDGPLGAIIASTTGLGAVRGYVQEPHLNLPPKVGGKLNVGEAVGKNGYIHITKDIGLKEPYSGSSPLVSGEIADDLASYFMQSEQIPSIVALGVLVDPDNSVVASGGYIIQLMPGADEETLAKLEKLQTSLMPVSNLISAGQNPEDIISTVLHGFEIKIQQTIPLDFKCKCNKDNFEKIMISLGESEIQDILDKDKGAEARCHFCNTYYQYNSEDLKRIINEIKK